jgi:phage tail-like protein
MARAVKLDYLHNMRFHVTAIGVGGIRPLEVNGPEAEAGFSAVTTPEATVEAVEYKEGQFLFTRKYPGHVTYGDVTMSRGIAKLDTQFYSWIDTVIMGTGEYRVDLSILHYHRDEALPGVHSAGLRDVTLLKAAAAAKTYYLYNALPVRCKLSSDLDATDSGVSIMELDVAYETAELRDPGRPNPT